MMARRSLLLLYLLLQGCEGARLLALPDSASQASDGRQAISKRLPNLNVTVEAGAWHHRPRRFTDEFLPFLVEIVNHSRLDVNLRLAEVSLVDDHGRTRRPLRPDEAVSLLLGGSDPSTLVPSIGIEATGPEPTIFNLELGFNFGRDRDLRHIRRLAFPPEPIPPGSRAEGFIYFPKPPPDASRLTVFLTLDAPSGRHELLFSYLVQRGGLNRTGQND